MMTSEGVQIAKARANVATARAKLTDTLGDLQHRLDPRAKVRAALDDVREHGSDLADRANVIVRERPTVTVAAAGLIAFVIARRPIARLFSAVTGRR